MQDHIHQIEVSNPFFEGRNSVYLLKCDPITLIDTGVATKLAFERLTHGLKNVGIALQDIRRVLLTHKHIDHIGNAWRIADLGRAEVFIHRQEQSSVTDVDPDGERFAALMEERLRSWHAPLPARREDNEPKMPQWQIESCSATPVDDGDELATEHGVLKVLHTPGHTMGSVCFRYDDCLFTGDHVLESISPNVGGGDMKAGGLLQHFLCSLSAVAEAGDVRAYPGHGRPFRGIQKRCAELQQHHRDRLKQTWNSVREPRSVYEVATALFGTLEDFHILLGCAEAHAHLEFLESNGAVLQTDGRFVAAADQLSVESF